MLGPENIAFSRGAVSSIMFKIPLNIHEIHLHHVSERVWKGCVYPRARPEAPRTREHADLPNAF